MKPEKLGGRGRPLLLNSAVISIEHCDLVAREIIFVFFIFQTMCVFSENIRVLRSFLAARSFQ